MGRGTRSAIIAFQQDRGMAATGVADQAWLTLEIQVKAAAVQILMGAAVFIDVARGIPFMEDPPATEVEEIHDIHRGFELAVPGAEGREGPPC